MRRIQQHGIIMSKAWRSCMECDALRMPWPFTIIVIHVINLSHIPHSKLLTNRGRKFNGLESLLLSYRSLILVKNLWSEDCRARAFICCDSTFHVTCSPQPHAHSCLCIMVRGQGNFTYTSIQWKKGKKEKIEFKWGRYSDMSTRKENPKPWGTIRRLKYNIIISLTLIPTCECV